MINWWKNKKQYLNDKYKICDKYYKKCWKKNFFDEIFFNLFNELKSTNQFKLIIECLWLLKSEFDVSIKINYKKNLFDQNNEILISIMKQSFLLKIWKCN